MRDLADSNHGFNGVTFRDIQLLKDLVLEYACHAMGVIAKLVGLHCESKPGRARVEGMRRRWLLFTVAEIVSTRQNDDQAEEFLAQR